MAIKKKQDGGFAPRLPEKSKVKKNVPTPATPKIDTSKTSKKPPLPGKNPNSPNVTPPNRKY